MTTTCPGGLFDQFKAFHTANPHVYVLFKRFTFVVLDRGYRNFGVAAIWERLRWETMIETQTDDVFKLNNNHKAYYARLFMAEYPEHKGFFRTRTIKSA